MGRLSGAIDRLSGREKALVGTMVGLAVVLVVFLGYLFLGGGVSDLEDRIAEDRDSLAKIHAFSHKYMAAVKEKEATRNIAVTNADINLRLAINDIAKGISFQARGRDGNVEGTKKLSDVVQFDQINEQKLSKRKKRGKRSKENQDVGYYRRDQPMTLSENVSFDAIYQLMERIEESDNLLYVTKLEFSRDFQDGRIARKNASMVISTYFYQGAEEDG